jgi:hypothetical protein
MRQRSQLSSSVRPRYLSMQSNLRSVLVVCLSLTACVDYAGGSPSQERYQLASVDGHQVPVSLPLAERALLGSTETPCEQRVRSGQLTIIEGARWLERTEYAIVCGETADTSHDEWGGVIVKTGSGLAFQESPQRPVLWTGVLRADSLILEILPWGADRFTPTRRWVYVRESVRPPA